MSVQRGYAFGGGAGFALALDGSRLGFDISMIAGGDLYEGDLVGDTALMVQLGIMIGVF